MNDNWMMVNDQFLEYLNSPEGLEKISDAGSTFIRLKLREAGFARRVMIPEFITVGELYREQNTDEFYKLKDLEPDSVAMPVTLRGRADYSYINAKRFKTTFYPIETERYEKQEDELLAYEMPITKLIEQNSIKDIQKVEDGGLITHVQAAIVLSGSTTTSAYVTGTEGNYMPKNVQTKLANLFTDNSLELEFILMNKKDFASIYLWPDLGSALSFEVIPNGYKYDTLNGIKVVTTIKSDLVPAGTVYGFANQSFFGDFYVLDDIKFYIKKDYDMISFFARERIGISLGNIKGCASVTLSGSL